MEWDLFGLITISRELGRIDGRLHKIETTLQSMENKMQTAFQDVIDGVEENKNLSSSINTAVTKLVDLFASQPTIEAVQKLAADIKASNEVDKATAAILANTPAGSGGGTPVPTPESRAR